MSVSKLESLAIRHWKKYLPNKVRNLRKEGMLQAEAHAAAVLAQTEIDHLMKYQHYPEYAAEEVALPLFILLPEGRDDPDEEDE